MDPTFLVPRMPEMWQFPVAGMVRAPLPAGGLGLRVVLVGGGTPVEESTPTEPSGGTAASGGRKRKDCSTASVVGGPSEDESSKIVSTSSGNDLIDSDGAKCLNNLKSANDNGNIKAEMEASSGPSNNLTNHNPQPSEPPKQDYIHVRARRGQATDSHSLAERARREKISDRMKILQDLVPGCNKVIGKASVLDEIINYVQALQHQVEFLSMKLEAFNSHVNSEIELFPPKDLTLHTYDSNSGLTFSSRATRGYEQGPAAEWLHMQVGASFERIS